MSCKKAVLALVILVATLPLGLRESWMNETADARPDELLALSPTVCLALLMDDTIPLDCYTMFMPISLRSVAALASGDSDPEIRPDNFETIDLDGNQMHQRDGQLFILAFVDHDSPVTFETSSGMFDRTSLWGDEAHQWLCDVEIEDEDCDSDGTLGDGVVVAWLWSCQSGNPAANTCPKRPEPGNGTVTVEQDGHERVVDFVIVGEPEELELLVVESKVQTSPDSASCDLERNPEDLAEAAALPEKTVIVARALDSDGNSVTGAFIRWKTDDRLKGSFAVPVTPTLDLAELEAVAPNVFCGGDDTGIVKVIADLVPLGADLDGSLCDAGIDCPFHLDPFAQPDRKKAQLTISGPPAEIALELNPPQFVCDGVTASNVVVTATDADGVPVADGNEVHFDVRVLGIADPVLSHTIGGSANSSVTPFSGISQGVPVVVTVGDIEGSALLSCQGPMPPALASPVLSAPPSAPLPSQPTFTPVLFPPQTGSGGDLPWRSPTSNRGISDFGDCGSSISPTP